MNRPLSCGAERGFSVGMFLSVCLVMVLAGLRVAQAATEFHAIELTGPDNRYPLISNVYSSGFIPAPEGLALDKAPDTVPAGERFGLSPDFRQHGRYWLYTRVVNLTQTSDWMLHISNFGFRQSGVLVRSDDGQVVQRFGKGGYGDTTDINTLGRAVNLNLQAGKSYLVVVELNARRGTWHPYIGLMSGQQYAAWAMHLDLAFKVAIGVILGLVVLGLVCWLLMSEVAFFWGALSSLLMLVYYLGHSSIPALIWQSAYLETDWFWWLVSSTLMTQLAFAGSFLRINRASGRWFQVFAGAALLTLVICLLATALPMEAKVRLYVLDYLVVSLVILGSGVAKVRREGSYYFIYLLGWFPVVLSMLQVVLVTQGASRAFQEVTESYKMLHVLYIQILHMLLHAVALILRVRALRDEKVRAEYLSQSKSRFIAQSSHDLSQPLNSMSIFLEHLQPHVQGLDGKKILYRLKNTHRQMSESFKSIMDLSKLESGAIRPELKAVQLNDLFARLQNEYRVLAREKGIELRFHPCSVTVFSDPMLLDRMLRNLVSNAVKYTDTGRVVVGCRRRGRQVAIQVLDTGCGMDDSVQQHIFDIYHRAADVPQKTEGAGIGLSIVRHIAELLEHPVNVISRPGQGSTFTLSVPVLADPALPRSAAADQGDSALKVSLIIQDDALRDALSARLQSWQCQVSVFRSVDEAWQSGWPAAVLLCDDAALTQTALPADAVQRLARDLVAACVCATDAALPAQWIAVSPQLLPSQLRALLNVAARRRQSPMSLDMPT